MREKMIVELRKVLEALENSEPKMKHYFEPVARHEAATKSVVGMLNELEAMKEDEFYCANF
jgi:hypothetical protein